MSQLAEKIFIAGHTGMAGIAIERQLLRLGHPKSHILHAPVVDLDWADPAQVERFLHATAPDQIYLPAPDFLQDRHCDAVQALLAKGALHNIITTAAKEGIRKLLLLVGSEVYPSSRLPPYAEEDLMGGPIGGSSTFDALAQLSAMKFCQELSVRSGGDLALDYRCAVLGGYYGPGDDYSAQTQQLVPQILNQLEHAKAHALQYCNVTLEEDTPLDLLYVDDMAEAAVYLMEMPRSVLAEQQNLIHHHINIGFGKTIKAQRLVQSLANAVGYFGKIVYAETPPNSPAIPKSLDAHRLARLGWTPLMSIEQGTEIVCADYQIHRKNRIKSP